MNEVFDFIEKKSFSTAVVKPSITLLCGRNIDSIVKNVFNLKRKVKNYLKKMLKQCILFIKSCIMQTLMIVRDYCLGLGIDKNIFNSCFSETSHKCFKLNNGAIIDLHDFLINIKYLLAKIQ